MIIAAGCEGSSRPTGRWHRRSVQVGGVWSDRLRGLWKRPAAIVGEEVVEAEGYRIRPERLSDSRHSRGVWNREGGHFGSRVLALESRGSERHWWSGVGCVRLRQRTGAAGHMCLEVDKFAWQMP